MITRERRAREAAEKACAELERQMAEERERAAEERRQLLAIIETLTECLREPRGTREQQNGGAGQPQQ